jgi:hypothetical protein
VAIVLGDAISQPTCCSVTTTESKRKRHTERRKREGSTCCSKEIERTFRRRCAQRSGNQQRSQEPLSLLESRPVLWFEQHRPCGSNQAPCKDQPPTTLAFASAKHHLCRFVPCFVQAGSRWWKDTGHKPDLIWTVVKFDVDGHFFRKLLSPQFKVLLRMDMSRKRPSSSPLSTMSGLDCVLFLQPVPHVGTTLSQFLLLYSDSLFHVHGSLNRFLLVSDVSSTWHSR